MAFKDRFYCTVCSDLSVKYLGKIGLRMKINNLEKGSSEIERTYKKENSSLGFIESVLEN